MSLTLEAIMAGATASHHTQIVEGQRRALLARHASEREDIETELAAINRRRLELIGLQTALNDRHESERESSSAEIQIASTRYAEEIANGAKLSGKTTREIADLYERQRTLLEESGVLPSLDGDPGPNHDAGSTPRAAAADTVEEVQPTAKPSRRNRRLLPDREKPGDQPPETGLEESDAAEEAATPVDIETTPVVEATPSTPRGSDAPVAANADPAGEQEDDTPNFVDPTTPAPNLAADEADHAEGHDHDVALTPARVEILTPTDGDGLTGHRAPTGDDETPILSPKPDDSDWFADVRRVVTEPKPAEIAAPALPPAEEEPVEEESPAFVEAPASHETTGQPIANDPAADQSAEPEDPFDALSRQFGGGPTIPFEVPDALKR